MKYIISKDGTEEDLYTIYKAYILSISGLHDCPTPKEPYIEEWIGENGQEVYESNTIVYKPIDVELEIAFAGTPTEVKANAKKLINKFTQRIEGKSEFNFLTRSKANNAIVYEPKVLRYVSANDSKLLLNSANDYNNPNVTVSVYTGKFKFVIDKPIL